MSPKARGTNTKCTGAGVGVSQLGGSASAPLRFQARPGLTGVGRISLHPGQRELGGKHWPAEKGLEWVGRPRAWPCWGRGDLRQLVLVPWLQCGDQDPNRKFY